MKILLCNRDPRSHVGGDAVQVYGYQRALQALGHQADYKWMLDPDAKGYDEAWLFHINFGWTLRQYWNVRKAGIPYRIFAIFYPGVYSDINANQCKEILYNATKIYCLSSVEKNEMINQWLLPAEVVEKIKIIPNGADKKIFNSVGTVTNSPRNFVMSAGRYENTKGFEHVIRAAKIANVPVLVVGSLGDRIFKESLQKIWADAWICDKMTQDILANYYRGAKVYVCASSGERNNLGLLEAHACGTQIISTPHNYGNEWLQGVEIVNPGDEVKLAEKIREIYDGKSHKEFKIYDWSEVVDLILK